MKTVLHSFPMLANIQALVCKREPMARLQSFEQLSFYSSVDLNQFRYSTSSRNHRLSGVCQRSSWIHVSTLSASRSWVLSWPTGHRQVVRSCASNVGQTAESGIRLVKRKGRLDEVCVEKFPEYSKTLIQSWILQGKVLVDGKAFFKAGTPVSRSADISIIASVPKFVCRAGYKLEAAIEHFGCDIKDKVALDAGLSTGGFTDCLLQYGAAFVYGVDVGYGQVSEKIRKEKRVCVMERTNLRYLAELPQLVDVVTLDLAFISILLVMPAVLAVMKPQSTLLTLIKPQFEATRSQVGRGGVVKDPEVHKEVVLKIVRGVEACGFRCQGWIESPLKGADGNIEFLACFNRHLPSLVLEDNPLKG